MGLRRSLTAHILALGLLFAGSVAGEDSIEDDPLPELPQADLEQIEWAEAEIELGKAVAGYHRALIEQLSGSRDPDHLLLIWQLDWLHGGEAADRAIARALPRARDNLLVNFAAMKICQVRPDRDFCLGRDYPARLRELEPDNAHLALWQMPVDPELPGFGSALETLARAPDWNDIFHRSLNNLLLTLDRVELSQTSLQACMEMVEAEHKLLQIERPEVIQGPPDSTEQRCQAPRSGDRNLAFSLASTNTTPPYIGLVRACQSERSVDDPLRSLCLAAGSRMMEQGKTLIENMVGVALLDELHPAAISTDQRQRHDARILFNTELGELMQQLSDQHLNALVERMLTLTVELGEVAAMDTLMTEIELWQAKRRGADGAEQPESSVDEAEPAEDPPESDEAPAPPPEDAESTRQLR